MWECRIRSHKTRKRANVIRHIKLFHDIDNREGSNANKDKTVEVTSFSDTSNYSNGFTQQSRMTSSGKPMSEERPMSEEKQNEKALYMKEEKSHRPQPRVDEYEDSEEETPSCQPSCIIKLAK